MVEGFNATQRELEILELRKEVSALKTNVEYWRLAAERRDTRKELTGLDVPEARTLDAPEPPQCEVQSVDAAAIQRILDEEIYFFRFEETYDYGDAVERIMALIPTVAQAQTGCDKEATFGEAGYNPAYDDGITFAIVQLAELTGSKDWQMRDGSEDHDTDVRDTIMDVLKCAGIYDDETGKFAALAQAVQEPVERTYLRGWNEGIEAVKELLERDGWLTLGATIDVLLETSPLPSASRGTEA